MKLIMMLKRLFSHTSVSLRISDQFKTQFRLPGRTTSVLSTGVVPYPNDPMIPKDKYFKPKGLDGTTMIPFMFSKHYKKYMIDTDAFRLIASPWGPQEHPRDHNGLRYRDYRVACMATKKGYSKKAYHRWRAMRILRTAAMYVLPDKGRKRCDYLFLARAPMRFMDRDLVFLKIEKALVQMESKIARSGNTRDRVIGMASAEDGDGGLDNVDSSKILNQDFAGQRHITSMSQIVEEMDK